MNQPILPYAGTSGWSGSETSKERAVKEDKNGTTSLRQKLTLNHVRHQFDRGLTWKELSEITNMHHGQSSGALSVLHKAGLIARLKERRNKCAVYVAPEYIQGREISLQKIKTCKHCGGHL
jgi:hypothetical protein